MKLGPGVVVELGVPQTVDAAPRTGVRSRKRERNRADLLVAAREVFHEMGVDAATVRDIVRRTDLASGTFYNYFRDKDDLVRTLLDETSAEVRRRVHEARVGADSLEAAVGGAYRAYFEFVAEERVMFEILYANMGAVKRVDPTGAAESAAASELAVDLEGLQRRFLRHDLDVPRMAMAMTGTAMALAVHMLKDDPPDVDATTAFATQLFVSAIRQLGDESTKAHP